MHTFTLSLWEDRPHVTMTGYLLHNSKEYQTDKRRPAVIVCPGGGFLMTSDREAEPVALRFAGLGYQAFVLRYSTYAKEGAFDLEMLSEPPVSQYPQPLYDLAQAIKTIRDNAAEWLIDPDRIAVAGFSAGGHVAASLGVHWHEPFLGDKLETDNERFKPNALLLGYPVVDFRYIKEEFDKRNNAQMQGLFTVVNRAVFGVPVPTGEQLEELNPCNHVSERTPPAFLWHTADDSLIFAGNSLRFANALAAHRVPYELHIFENGVHGLSLSDDTTAVDETQRNADVAAWFELAAKWLKKRF